MITGSHHLGILKTPSRTRVAVLFKQLPDDQLKALILKIDTVRSDAKQLMLADLLSSAEANKEKNFADVLHRRNILKELHDDGYLESVHIDEVFMTPNDSMEIPLRDVINAMHTQEGLPRLPTDEEMKSAESSRDPNATRRQNDLLDTENRKAIAKNILIQANMLQAEANKKYEEAYKLDSSLRKNTSYQSDLLEDTKTVVKSRTTNKKTTKPTAKKKAKA